MKTLVYYVKEEEDGRTLKKIVRAGLHVSHRLFSNVKFSGGLILDGASVHADQIVRAGQKIELVFPDDEPTGATGEDGDVNIAYEDEDIAIVEKPAPLASQRSPRKPQGSLQGRMERRYADMPGYVFRPVNRLDKGTSGLMVVAKHAYAQNELQKLLHTDEFRREYLAVLDGCPAEPFGAIDAPIAKADGATVRREVNFERGVSARTEYRVILPGARSIVRLRLYTGRTHQIRVHMSHIGCPVAGDFLYGAEDARLPGRFALHSAFISLRHPTTGKILTFESPLPDELAALAKESEEEKCVKEF